jgi:hypothetical protein
MANKENNSSTVPNGAGLFGDMSILREIIMGPKVIEYNERFDEILSLIAKNEEATQQRFIAFEKEMNTRFDKLENILKQNVEQLDNQMKNMSKGDKTDLAELLVELSKKLKEK